ncbi:hypothetical protein [Streptomyces sp. NPDC127066]|uniref:hypothetical protein n=1 Tax=Streptomyces sp. NPDC127066 TaxID=3347125 RepID=UPI0036642646
MSASSMALAPGGIDPNPTGLEDSRTVPQLHRFDNDSKIGDVSNEQLRFLIDHLANGEDTEFYVDYTILKSLADIGADRILIGMLENSCLAARRLPRLSVRPRARVRLPGARVPLPFARPSCRAVPALALLFDHVGVREGQPFILGADGSYDVQLNRLPPSAYGVLHPHRKTNGPGCSHR